MSKKQERIERIKNGLVACGKRVGDAVSSEDGDVVAAAIGISLLTHLRTAALEKALTYADIQASMEAFIEGAGVVEDRTPTGFPIYKRNTDSTVPANT